MSHMQNPALQGRVSREMLDGYLHRVLILKSYQVQFLIRHLIRSELAATLAAVILGGAFA